MPLISHSDPLPHQPNRILVSGTSGSGKSTLARAVADRLHLPYIELDSLFHGPNWTPRPEFESEVEALSSGERWVTEWQYRKVKDLLASRADTMLWLDYPKALVMWRVSRRTIARRLRRTELWNGNREPPLRAIFSEPTHIVRWAWNTHEKNRLQVEELMQAKPGLTVVRLRSPRQTKGWLEWALEDASG